ncbi:PQQ-binding-like beta-propeller repeat protein [Streptomyces sp. NBC_00103]|uniref:PQQ-binding-like beta-propeller repeat protein n=1 Tax=Streptomyces sp. NBC_00103 TaxID=2975653 RepID=UPI0022503236|nr:PQQ-binding-like beta-propeller repeat protein [Streptomyces sp. NBC_00103]MCX5369103.1 PQQ-like beta-propeller repeat protein [Streptomyces sp. NBC_00103]
MNQQMRRHLLPLTGALVSLGLVAGCGGGDDTATGGATDGKATPKASASIARGPAYEGAALPGLARKPVWSLTADGVSGCPGDPVEQATSRVVGDHSQTCVLGDAVVLTEDATTYPDSTGGAPEEYLFRARLLDAATGRERTSVEVTIPADGWSSDRDPAPAEFFTIGQWKDGTPALLAVDGDVTPASGLKKESVRTTYTMYAPSGEKLGSSAYDGEDGTDHTVEAGHVRLRAGNDSGSYAPLGGGATVEVQDRWEDQAPIGAGFGYRVATSLAEFYVSGDRLQVSDRLTGKELWDTEGVTLPAAVAAQTPDGDRAAASLFPLAGDRGLLAWGLKDDTYDALLTVVDLGTGRTLVEGPKTFLDPNDAHEPVVVLSADGKSVVTQFGGGAVAWNAETGDELWRQEADEQDIEPVALPTGDVLYASVSDLGLAALDMRTKKVLASGLEPGSSLNDDVDVLERTSDGHALLATSEGVFVFAPEEA